MKEHGKKNNLRLLWYGGWAHPQLEGVELTDLVSFPQFVDIFSLFAASVI